MSFAAKLSLLRRMQFLPRKQLEDFYTKVIVPSVTYGPVVWERATRHTSAIWKNYSLEPDVLYTDYHRTPVLQTFRDVLMQTRWDSLEIMYKVRLAEFTFNCIKGYNATELNDLFVQRNSSRESRGNGEIVFPSPETNSMRNSIK